MGFMTMHEAAECGIARLRDPEWRHPRDFIEIQLVRDPKVLAQGVTHGPIVRFYSAVNEIVGNPNPMAFEFTAFDWDDRKWLPFAEASA